MAVLNILGFSRTVYLFYYFLIVVGQKEKETNT